MNDDLPPGAYVGMANGTIMTLREYQAWSRRIDGTRKAVSREERLRRLFLGRTAASYGSQKRRAAKVGQRLDYRLSELRTLVQEVLRGKRPYCRCELSARNFSVDHALPISRGGCYDWQNLKTSCQGCNRAKGPHTAEEFEDLRKATSS